MKSFKADVEVPLEFANVETRGYRKDEVVVPKVKHEEIEPVTEKGTETVGKERQDCVVKSVKNTDDKDKAMEEILLKSEPKNETGKGGNGLEEPGVKLLITELFRMDYEDLKDISKFVVDIELEGKCCTAHIDTGASANFVNPSVVKGLKLQRIAPMQVAPAFGQSRVID